MTINTQARYNTNMSAIDASSSPSSLFSSSPSHSPRSLIVGGLWPEHEKIVEEQLECLNQTLWIRCESGLLWDPYGSLMRTLLMSLLRFPTIKTVYVVAETAGPNSTSSSGHNSPERNLAPLVPPKTLNTIRFLLQYYGINPDDWLRADDSSAPLYVAQSLRVIRRHPLLPQRVTVKGFFLKEPEGILNPIEEE